MGTRNLTMVVKDSELRVSQYGQWDGYPIGQGKTVLKFLQRLIQNNEQKAFIDAIDNVTHLPNKDGESYAIENYPHCSRDHGAEILNIILDNKGELELWMHWEFMYDSLFCEFAYLIDLDNNTLEFYTGFNTKALDKSQRFFKENFEPIDYQSKYHPIVCQRIFSIAEMDLSDEGIASIIAEMNEISDPDGEEDAI